MRASCRTRLYPAPAVSHQKFLEASKPHFEWEDSLVSLTSEMLVDVMMPFAQTWEGQGVTTLRMRWQATSVKGETDPSTLSNN